MNMEKVKDRIAQGIACCVVLLLGIGIGNLIFTNWKMFVAYVVLIFILWLCLWTGWRLGAIDAR